VWPARNDIPLPAKFGHPADRAGLAGPACVAGAKERLVISEFPGALDDGADREIRIVEGLE
jgi:hypothetical protein